MEITGNNYIGNELSARGRKIFTAFDPGNQKILPGEFKDATEEEIDQAVTKAEEAFHVYRKVDTERRADFLQLVGEEIMRTGMKLIQRCREETGLPEARLLGERTRTVNQLNMFASLLREGSWVNASIDNATEEHPSRPDIRQMQKAIGPVGVFGASNFPFAFSVAGGDTASALAAGCTVVVKGHPAHPGTSELTAEAIISAVEQSGMPDGTFSLLQGEGTEVGIKLVIHPLIKAVGFTGSFRGGKAIFDAAAGRNEPIPVYAEMGSVNPVFILPDALRSQRSPIAEGLVSSITLGAGQFCTNPGLVIVEDNEAFPEFKKEISTRLKEMPSSAMLTRGIRQAFGQGILEFLKVDGVSEIAQGGGPDTQCLGRPFILQTSASTLIQNDVLSSEVFGPSSLFVLSKGKKDLHDIIRHLEGQLTVTIHATPKDLKEYGGIIELLERKAGRIILNGFPTGVEVCSSMIHGGPFPATTDSKTTSVGTLAIYRFCRPVCYQNFGEEWLPQELKSNNPKSILRLVNGKYTRDRMS